MIKTADWIVALGPEGVDAGRPHVVAVGTPGHTAHHLTYFPQTWEPEVQTKGTVMPVQQVV